MGRSDQITLPADTAFLRDPCAQRVCDVLESAGHAIYFVGGCVRNALIGAAQSDVDLATDALPDRVMALSKAAGLRAIPTGIAHGTVTIVCDDAPFEITTFRRDVETDGRRAVVAFSDRIEEDARRRDFTMNALYAQPNGTVVDPVGGVSDAMKGRVVFIDDARQRIREDYLRILRFFRFWAHYATQEDGFDPDALAAIAETLDGLETLSAERIGAELSKLLLAPDPAMAIATMDKVGVLGRLLPIKGTDAFFRLIQLEQQSATKPNAIRRLASLGPMDAIKRLRLSKRDSRDLLQLLDMAGQTWGPKALGALLGTERGWDAVLLRAASLGTQLTETRDDVATGASARFPVEAKDLMPRLSGPELGAELKRLREIWLRSELGLDKAALLG